MPKALPGQAASFIQHAQPAEAVEAAISVRGLTKRYGDIQVLDGIDLDVRRGELVAVVGPNAAGKTTLVEILEGYRERDAGTADVLGADPAQPTRHWRARIGIVLQTCELPPELTVWELVEPSSGIPNCSFSTSRRPGSILRRVIRRGL